MKIKIKSDDNLLLEKTLNMYNAVMLIIFVFYKSHNQVTIKCFEKNFNINNMEMLYYNRSDVSEGIHVNKTSVSKIYYLSLLVFFR